MAIELTSQNFKEEVLDFDGVVVIDFWADWCGPCKMLSPVIEEVSSEFADNEKVKVCKVNVDENSDLAQEYGIMSIPALKFFRGGEIVHELVGLQPRDAIIESLNKLIAN
ncbi:thioredoxin [Candidatus Dojkabacteria bacterium]|nr:thioredoxin [Candidatus Dojkabacteria bacterium]